MIESVRTDGYITVEQYLESEKHSEERHEYFDGRVWAMAGASEDHELVAGNLFAAIHSHLRGKPCRVFKDGMKVRLRVKDGDLFYYPDILVACDPAGANRYYREQAKLAIEVLSSDEHKDLVEKYMAYQTIPSMEEYVVVSQDPRDPMVRIFRKASDWALGEVYREGEFRLESIGLSFRVADLYSE
jgi:Uma2 family endonuclease